MNNHELKSKAIRVISSCTRLKQLDVAENYCRLVSKTISDNNFKNKDYMSFFKGVIKLKTKQIVDGGKIQ